MSTGILYGKKLIIVIDETNPLSVGDNQLRFVILDALPRLFFTRK